MIHTLKVYKAPSGQWSWEIKEGDEPVAGGAGYDTEKAARDEGEAELVRFCPEEQR